MALQVIYSNATGTTLDISTRVSGASERLSLPGVSVKENAEEGSVPTSELIVDDPDGDLTIVGLRRIYMVETSAPAGNQNIGNWFTADRTVSRGAWHVGPLARTWSVNMVDENSLLERRLFVGTDSNRPAETDIVRVAWLLTTTELNTVDDDLYVATSDGVAMDAVDYSGQRAVEVLRDCAEASGRNYFVWYRESAAAYSLWYNFNSAALYVSDLRLSNAGDEDNDTTFAVTEATLTRDPSRVYSGVLMEFDSSASPVYVQNTATGNTFTFRDTGSSSMNVKTLAKATARATRYLGDIDEELDVVRASAVLPAAKVTGIKKGMLVECQFTHFPWYSGYTWYRVLTLGIEQVTPTDYKLALELDPVCFSGFVIVGGTGLEVAHSTDGITWTQANTLPGTSVALRECAFGGCLWVAVGNAGRLYTSSDAATWTQRTSGFGTTLINAVAWGNGLWNAVGQGQITSHSTDGTTWTMVGVGYAEHHAVAYADGLWLINTGQGYLASSTDGLTWLGNYAALSVPTDGLFAIAWGNGLWVVGGEGGLLSTSPSGLSGTWTYRNIGAWAGNNITAIAYGNGAWLATGNNGEVATSPDGMSWTVRTTGLTSAQDVAYGAGLWVIVGSGLATSPDGITWTQRVSGFADASIFGIGYGGPRT